MDPMDELQINLMDPADIRAKLSAAEELYRIRLEAADRMKREADDLSRFIVALAKIAGVDYFPDHKRTRGPRVAKRKPILDALADGTEKSTEEIRVALRERGVIGDSNAEAHSLLVTLSRMYRNGELVRPRQSVYRLAPSLS